MNYSEQVFNILNIEPEEKFNLIDDNGEELYYKYKITEELKLRFSDGGVCPYSISDILSGKFEIVRISNYSEYQQKIVDAALTLGFCYFARNKDGELMAYKTEPIKRVSVWTDGTDYFTVTERENEEFRNIKWEDRKPYYLKK